MRTNLSLLSLAVGLLFVALWQVPARLAHSTPAPAVTVNLTTPSVPQGGTVYLTVDAPEATKVQVRRDGKTYLAEKRADGRWEAILGVWMEDKPGVHPLAVDAEINGDTVTSTKSYTVTKRTFPIQRLSMSKEQEDKYDDASVQEEYRLIRGAINAKDHPRAWEGPLALPAKGRLSTLYGVQRYRNGKKVSIHKGIDIAGGRGATIVAANHGTVTLRREFGMHGHTVVVDHGGGLVGLYLHLQDFAVTEGQEVKAGDKIGTIGDTGVATGPHLHYALYVHGVAIDPTLWTKLPAGW